MSDDMCLGILGIFMSSVSAQVRKSVQSQPDKDPEGVDPSCFLLKVKWSMLRCLGLI